MECKTMVQVGARPINADPTQAACLVHIYPSGPEMGIRYSVNDTPVLLGRANDCHVQIQDSSVSRHHARIQPGAEGYYAVDLNSTNGTYINDVPLQMQKLRDGDYLRVGNCIYRFLMGGNIEANYHEEIYRLTIMDGLTGCHNKRYLAETLERELARSIRYHRPLTVILFDVDHFKRINDEMGHLGGDFTLREIAHRIKSTVRKEEVFARYGGEEFMSLLPEANLEGAAIVAKRFLHAVSDQPFQFEDKVFSVTISAGIGTTAGGEKDINAAELVRRADDKLYEAKRTGRNRFCM